MDAILRRHPDQPTKVFVIWEPILPTDWSRPTTFAMKRIGDQRVQQYWDPDHHVARKLAADARSPQPVPDCCERSGILWDLAAVYPPGVSWNERLPPAVVFNGSVIDVAAQIESALRAAQ